MVDSLVAVFVGRTGCTGRRRQAGALAKFVEQGLGGVDVGLFGVGGVGPDGVVDDFGGFRGIHVESGFHAIGGFLSLVVAVAADFGSAVFGTRRVHGMASASGGLSGRTGRQPCIKLGFEFAQKAFAFLFERGGVGNGLQSARCYRRKAL